MFLRSTTRLKDGKKHCYWSIVEKRRCRADRVVQQTVLYLGEINDSQREQWIRAIVALQRPWRAVFPFDVVRPSCTYFQNDPKKEILKDQAS
jgi:hypothetical protein